MASVFTPSTWNTLGLGVATCYATLGLSAALVPHRTAALLGFRVSGGPAGNPDGYDDNVPGMMAFIGARDLSIAAALFAFGGDGGGNREMGTLILSTMILCTVDVCVAWRNGKRLE